MAILLFLKKKTKYEDKWKQRAVFHDYEEACAYIEKKMKKRNFNNKIIAY